MAVTFHFHSTAVESIGCTLHSLAQTHTTHTSFAFFTLHFFTFPYVTSAVTHPKIIHYRGIPQRNSIAFGSKAGIAMSTQTVEVVKVGTVADASSAPVGPGTAYSIQMTECQTCTKNVQTINTMLTVMHQQATTVKDQQATIANLITMLSNATGGTVVKVEQLPSRSLGPHLTASGKRSHHKRPDGPSIITLTGPGGASKVLQITPTRATPTKKRAISTSAASSAPKARKVTNGDVSENGSAFSQEFVVKHQSVGGGSDQGDEVVTKIWIRGTPHEKCPCPLDECAGRKFAAADMYYLRRHFQQVHRLTHPNPLFVIQCPVEECGAEFESSLREMRKHLNKDHPDVFPPGSLSKHHHNPEAEDEELDDTEGGGEDAEAAAELAGSEDDV
ncbi:hypothetical protein BV898_14530 [Hypsibius exemplaris]|uniref:Uncharacterized protein n=1 Tax=Hypsibius exemplaris TaxID=2072580 RepID=A0A9X6RJM8_HYPEX|nr:hypothetical protein BV898_14530 [Hypsibius exemplaris]